MLSERALKYLDERSKEVLDATYRDAVLPLLKTSMNASSKYSSEILNDISTDRFSIILKRLGYSSYYDAYVHLSSIPDLPEYLSKGGQKDMSKLSAVKRTVIRNGKPVTITVYEDNSSDEEEGSSNGKGDTGIPKASELPASYSSDHKKAQETMGQLKGSTLYGTKKTSTLYLTISSKDGTPIAVVGYKRFGHYLKLMFVNSIKDVEGVLERAFFELAKLCLSKKLGMKLDKKISKTLPYKNMYNMEEDYRGDAYLGFEELKKVFGDLG